MSKTDVHRPWAVQQQDPYNRHLLYRFQVWPWATELIAYKNMGCGCSLCTGHHQRKRARRAERHQLQRDLCALVGQWAGGELDEDAPLPRRVDTW